MTLRQWLHQNALWRRLSAHSWALSAISLVLLTTGGIIANATAATHFTTACGSATFCLGGLGHFLFGNLEGWLINFGAVLGVLSLYMNYDDKARIAELLNEIDTKSEEIAALNNVTGQLSVLQVDTYRHFSLLLKQISEDFNFGPAERLSLYRRSADQYFLLGRHSEHAEFSQRHRSYYPAWNSVIQRAWEVGWCEAKITANPVNVGKYAKEVERRFGIPKDTVRGLTMKSRCLKAAALVDPKTGHRVAILCAESLEPSGLQWVDQAVLEGPCKTLVLVLDALEHHVASLEDAIAAGL
jgi:hypothetical protein